MAVTTVLSITCALLLAVLILGALAWYQQRSLASLLRSRYVITLKSGEAFEGILQAHNRRQFVLVNAKQLGRTQEVPVDGSLYLLRDQVLYLQKLGGAE